MKWILVERFLFLLYVSVVVTEGFKSVETITTNSKEAEKPPYPKKVNSIKKDILKNSLKKIADITEKFKDLPEDDFIFIKELDKQFKLHSGKIKIKIEKCNETEMESKNSKRTINDELGYGYVSNGYHYNSPKFMFYPYSQQNIGNNAANYYLAGDERTEVSIEPSYSYELKSQTYVTDNEQQIDVHKPEIEQQKVDLLKSEPITQNQHQYEEPVIVLRIPGPAKYATHLQMLLQKYLEIRAAQYFHILQDSEEKKSQQQYQLQQLDYGHGIAEGLIQTAENHQYNIPVAGQEDHMKEIPYRHQSSIRYPEIDSVYNNYKNRYSSHRAQISMSLQQKPSYHSMQQKEEQKVSEFENQLQGKQTDGFQIRYQQKAEEESQYYYTQPSEVLPDNTYHQLYLVSMAAHEPEHGSSPSQPQNHHIYVQNQPNEKEPLASLPIAENNPRPSHTKVTFNKKKGDTISDYQMYQLPSIKPNERHAPTSIPNYHQDFYQRPPLQNLDERLTAQESFTNYQNLYNAADRPNTEIVTITQRPYNYHAYRVKDSSKEGISAQQNNKNK